MGTRVEGTAIQGVHHFEKRTAKEGAKIGGSRKQGTRVEGAGLGNILAGLKVVERYRKLMQSTKVAATKVI